MTPQPNLSGRHKWLTCDADARKIEELLGMPPETMRLASGTAIPSVEWLLDWRDGKKSAQENGLHYLLKL